VHLENISPAEEAWIYRLALMYSSLWLMKSQVGMRTPKLSVSTVLEILSKLYNEKPDVALTMQGAIDGWMKCSCLCSLLPHTREETREQHRIAGY